MTLAGPPDTKYENTAWLAEISFPEDYPKSPPKCAFLTDIPFSAGGSWNDNEGRQVLCLSILGDAAEHHAEWAGGQSEAHGWSPATTLSNLLVNLQALLFADCLDDVGAWEASAKVRRRGETR